MFDTFTMCLVVYFSLLTYSFLKPGEWHLPFLLFALRRSPLSFLFLVCLFVCMFLCVFRTVVDRGVVFFCTNEFLFFCIFAGLAAFIKHLLYYPIPELLISIFCGFMEFHHCIPALCYWCSYFAGSVFVFSFEYAAWSTIG